MSGDLVPFWIARCVVLASKRTKASRQTRQQFGIRKDVLSYNLNDHTVSVLKLGLRRFLFVDCRQAHILSRQFVLFVHAVFYRCHAIGMLRIAFHFTTNDDEEIEIHRKSTRGMTIGTKRDEKV